jgi:hypothetical protein
MQDFGIIVPGSMVMYYDNKAATFIINNPAFHEMTKHIEVDCHFIRDATLEGKISTPYNTIEEHIVDIFIKVLSKTHEIFVF